MSRQATPLLLTVLLALLGLVAAPAAASGAPQAAGVQAHLMWGSVPTSEVVRQLDEAKAAGAQVVRVDFGWQSLEEQGKGRMADWYLRKMDTVVAEAGKRNLRLLVTVMWTPCWASSAPESLKQGCADGWAARGVNRYPPVDVADYADVVRFLTARYAGRVAAWEIWNEPNLEHFWASERPAADYAALLKAAYPAAKAGDPSTTVVGGALSESDLAFTRALYAQGVKGSFDAFSIHPYSHDWSPDRVLTDVRSSFVAGVPAVREIMVAHGDTRPMWLTELGWSTSTVRGQAPWRNGVDERTQAAYLRQAFATMRRWDFVAVGVWYNLVDWNDDAADHVANFGLVRHDHSPKPAYAAFRDAAAMVGTPPADAGQATSPTRSAARTYRYSASCVRGRLVVRGAAPRGALVRVEAYRLRAFRANGRRVGRPAYRRTVRAVNGRFAVRPKQRLLRGCRYRTRVVHTRRTTGGPARV